MGHSSITVSYDTYGHLFPEREAEITHGLTRCSARCGVLVDPLAVTRLGCLAYIAREQDFASALGGIRTPNLLIRSRSSQVLHM
jgi:hypothetical protein